jgi:hypothetical protein
MWMGVMTVAGRSWSVRRMCICSAAGITITDAMFTVTAIGERSVAAGVVAMAAGMVESVNFGP